MSFARAPAIGIATGLSENEVAAPTDEQREQLDALLRNYKLAIKLVNVETMKERL